MTVATRMATATPDLEVPLPEPPHRDINTMALRMHARHPEVSLTTITALLLEAHADLPGSRVQSFGMILTERAVRRRLALTKRRS